MFPDALEGIVTNFFSLSYVIGDFFKELETKKRVIYWIPCPPQWPFYPPAIPWECREEWNPNTAILFAVLVTFVFCHLLLVFKVGDKSWKTAYHWIEISKHLYLFKGRKCICCCLFANSTFDLRHFHIALGFLSVSGARVVCKWKQNVAWIEFLSKSCLTHICLWFYRMRENQF